MRASLLLAGTLVTLAAIHPTTPAGCCGGDPSALDLDPMVEPLRVARDGETGDLDLTWEDKSAGYRVWQGDLHELRTTGELNDSVVARVSLAHVRLLEPVGGAYFLVSTDCFDLHCTRGRDSRGVERITPGCDLLERGELYSSTARCLGPGNGVVRTGTEYTDFASCFFPGSAPDPPASGEALVWATDYSDAACGTCLEFPCARRIGDVLQAETAGAPWGDCDAIHDGGAWARVVDAPTITILEEMPPIPEYHPCP
jgi:hypothetical protein